MSEGFTKLEKTILMGKGLSEEKVSALVETGVTSKADFATVGDADLLAELIDIDRDTAQAVMAWACPQTAPAPTQGQQTNLSAQLSEAIQGIEVNAADVVYCHHCEYKQPKDYRAGNLCPNCGNLAEPQTICHWCGESGPGGFCRSCGAKYVPNSEYELAVQLRREGYAKDEVEKRLSSMSASEKETLWAKIRVR